MQMIFLRKIPFLDDQTLAPGEAREALFRDERCGFLLYLSDDLAPSDERIIHLDAREALIWLNGMAQTDELACDPGLWAEPAQLSEQMMLSERKGSS